MNQMAQRMSAMEAELVQQRAANATLQQLVQNMPAAMAAQTAVPNRVAGVDTRGLGKPDTFDGVAAKWRDWKVVVRSYTAACNDQLGDLMTRAEETEDPISNVVLGGPGEKEASEQLAFILVMVCRDAALDQVVNAGPAEGLVA